jgi:hypothetical protein
MQHRRLSNVRRTIIFIVIEADLLLPKIGFIDQRHSSSQPVVTFLESPVRL